MYNCRSVVPTVYTDVSGHTINSNQFSVTEHFKSASAGHFSTLPGVFFFYDLSPIKKEKYVHLQCSPRSHRKVL
ncbi:putative endoplasmic reticulum-Golgi intermediate compartment protein 3 [Bienertia sinuspersici]